MIQKKSAKICQADSSLHIVQQIFSKLGFVINLTRIIYMKLTNSHKNPLFESLFYSQSLPKIHFKWLFQCTDLKVYCRRYHVEMFYSLQWKLNGGDLALFCSVSFKWLP